MVALVLVAAAVCPFPPLLVPEVSRANPDWLIELRAATLAAVRRLTESGADRIVAIGPGSVTREYDGRAGGTMRGFGVDASFGGPDQALPLSLTIAAYLLDAVGWTRPRSYLELDRDRDTWFAAGADVALQDDVAILAMGDLSARLTRASPGPYDERAEGFDRSVVTALATNPQALRALDAAEARDLWVAGLPAWLALAGALPAGAVLTPTYDEQPTGAGYLVAEWSR